MFVREADRAQNLVRNSRAELRGLAHHYFGHSDLEAGILGRTKPCRRQPPLIQRTRRIGRRNPCGRDLPGKDRELLLDGLKLADLATELFPLASISDRKREDRLECASHLRGPRCRQQSSKNIFGKIDDLVLDR